jgi:hypothetical protein
VRQVKVSQQEGELFGVVASIVEDAINVAI